MKNGDVKFLSKLLGNLYFTLGGSLRKAPDYVRSNPGLVKKYIEKKGAYQINYANENILTDEMIDLAIKNGYSLSNDSPDVLKKNSKVVIASVKENPFSVEYALEEGITDEVTSILLNYPDQLVAILIYTHTSFDGKKILLNNSDIMKVVVERNAKCIEQALEGGLTYENAKLAFRNGYTFKSAFGEYINSSALSVLNNPNFVKAAIEEDPKNIEYALEDGLTYENAKLALEKGYVLKFGSPEMLRNNPQVVRASIEKDVNSVDYALEGSLTEENIRLLIENGYVLNIDSSEALKNNPNFIKAIIEKDPKNIKYALEGGLTGENINLLIEKGYVLNIDSPEALKNNPNFVKVSIEKDINSADYALEGGLTKENINLLIEKGYVLNQNSSYYIKNNPQIVRTSIENDVNKAYYALEGGLTKENINLLIEKGYVLKYDSPEILRCNCDLVKITLNKYFGSTTFLDEQIRNNIKNKYKLTNEAFNILNSELPDDKKLVTILSYFDISDENLQYEFTQYILNHVNIAEEKINVSADVLCRLSSTNSSEMIRLKNELATQLLNTDDPLKNLDKVEKLFIKNNIPTVGKLYSCFDILHPDFKGYDFDNNKVSPILKSSSVQAKKIIVFSDLIKASFGSNNKSVNEYLRNIEIASNLYENIKSGKVQYNAISEEEKQELITFSKHLATLYDNTMKAKKNNENFILTGNALADILELSKKLSPDGILDYSLKDRVIRMFCGFAGIDTLEEAQEYINNKIKTADMRNRNASQMDISLEKGDFIKGIGDITYLRNILQNGSVARDYLGSAADSDSTPLDTDLSMVMSSDGSISEKRSHLAAREFGPIWFVLKNDDRFQITRNNQETSNTKRDLSKIEVFYTGASGLDHYGIRTGFASSEINYILMDNYDPRVGLTIAMNGFYIPVANAEGKIVFTPDDYDKLRAKMSGLSYYDEQNYAFSDNLVTEETKYFAEQLDKSNREVQIKRDKINQVIKKSLNEIGLALKTDIDGDLTEGFVELIDTGSTGRGTNKPGDGDFDFMMRLDRRIINNPSELQKLKQTLLKNLGRENSSEITGDGDFRLKNVPIDANTNVDIDITFNIRTDKVNYSTDMALRDRLSTIQKNDPEKYKYVVANILLAKKVLKEANAYKPERSDKSQGGLGGVGIENWILQNGGSFIDAARNFVEVAEGKNFEQFKKCYEICDFGDNLLAERKNKFPNDNFVSVNMSLDGYNKMVDVLKKYLKKLEINKNTSNIDNSSSIIADNMIKAMESGLIDVDGNLIKNQNTYSSSSKTMGFSGVLLLIFVTTIMCLFILIFGVILE